MDFKDSILLLSEKIKKQKDTILTEEATKNSFILPMIFALGYDAFDPFEVIPEMDCDLTKKGDKVDYAIKKGNDTLFLIECKHCKQDLSLFTTQLAKYYAASNSRFGVLTNGIEYNFYTDLNKTNIMDEKPFLSINMLDISDSDIEQLKKFHKSYYNEAEILSTAQELQISIQIKDILANDIKQPSDDFIRYFVRGINDGKYSQKLVEQYKPIVKKSISSVINDIIQERLNLASNNVEEKQVEEKETSKIKSGLKDDVVFEDKDKGIITTKEEIDAYNIIRCIVRKNVKANRIVYKDYKSYFSIGIEDASCWWICRLSFGSRKKSIYFPNTGYASTYKIDIESIDDLFSHISDFDKSFEIANKAVINWYNKKQNK